MAALHEEQTPEARECGEIALQSLYIFPGIAWIASPRLTALHSAIYMSSSSIFEGKIQPIKLKKVHVSRLLPRHPCTCLLLAHRPSLYPPFGVHYPERSSHWESHCSKTSVPKSPSQQWGPKAANSPFYLPSYALAEKQLSSRASHWDLLPRQERMKHTLLTILMNM